MKVKILNDTTYKKECYLFGYGIQGYGVSPHSKKAKDFFDDELEEIEEFLKNRKANYELFGKKVERESEVVKKNTSPRKKSVKRKKG